MDRFFSNYRGPSVDENVLNEKGEASNVSSGSRHKKEGRKGSGHDLGRIVLELSKMSHPQENKSHNHYNFSHCKHSSKASVINIDESVAMGNRMLLTFCT